MDQLEGREPINIGLLAHVDAGKTTLTEQMLYLSGAVRTKGRVDQGTAHTDRMDIERKRGISVRSAPASICWKGERINIIDTPGHSDFSSEVQRSIRALDAAVIVISAVEGIQPQTEIFCDALNFSNLPVIFFINKIDRAGADAGGVMRDIERSFGALLIPPYRQGKGDELVDIISQADDRLLEKYVEQGPGSICEEEIAEAYSKAFFKREVFPCMSGSALSGEGAGELLDLISLLARFKSKSGTGNELSAVIFRLEHHSQLGRAAYVRLFSGCIQNRDPIYNTSGRKYEKVFQIKKFAGVKEVDAGKVCAGEISVLFGLSDSKNGDILGADLMIAPLSKMSSPYINVAVRTRSDEGYPALSAALEEISAEDPSVQIIRDNGSKELKTSVSGMLQREVIETMLREKYFIDAETGEPEVIYKERPARKGCGYVEYTMPKPCWAVLRFETEPLEIGSGVVFESRVREEKIFTKYQEQVRQTIPEALRQGPKGWQVTDIKITLVDGEHHLVHTHPLDFVLAAPIGIMDALTDSGTDLMEPISRFRISYPEELSGKMIGEILAMRGTFDSPVIRKGVAVMEGRYPVAEGFEFPARFSSITGGRGTLSICFDGYDICPPGEGRQTPYRGISPAEKEKYILHKRGAVR